MKQTEIAVCGQNRALDDIAARLAEDRRNRVIRLGSRLEDSAWDLMMTGPDVVFFAIGNGDGMPDNAFFRAYPQTRFIGVDPEGNYVISFFGDEQAVGNRMD